MDTVKKIRVLVVDDSAVFREVISRGISIEPSIEVAATAGNPFEARDKIIQYRPDVMTLDVEMPRMNGIEFLRKLMPQYPIPVVMVSGADGCVFDAMNAGAVDFVAKPASITAGNIEDFINEMIFKIKIASAVDISCLKRNSSQQISTAVNNGEKFHNKVIAIGASTGGTEAIYSVLKNLPECIPGIVVVQHIPPVFSRMFAERLDKQTALHVKEACSGDMIERGRVLVAPGDKHMRIKRAGDRYKVECFEGEKVNGHCPSIDVLFKSVADEAGSNAVGIILTGMGSDGAKGLLAMRKRGAMTIGQDEKSCVVYGMPGVAYKMGAVEIQAPLDEIHRVLCMMLDK